MDGARFLRVLAIRPGEGRLVASVATVFALLEGARGFGEVGAGALVLARFGPEALPSTLPFLFIALGVTSFVVSLGYSVALGRLPRVPLFVRILAGTAALLVVERVGLAIGAGDLVPVLWLTVLASSGIGLTMAWTIGGAAFDARQAKRLFPLLTSAAIAGSFAGNLLAGPVAAVISVESLVVVQAILLVLAAVLLTRLPRPRRRPSVATIRRSVVDDLRTGFDTVISSPLMRLVALVYVLLAVLMFSVEFPFLIAASREFPDKVELATALGLLSTAVTATSFVLSLVVANRLYARLGVTAGALALPVVYLGGFVVWLVQFSFPTAAAFRFVQQATQRGLSNASWSAFYNVVPAERRAQVIAFNDGVPVQVGTVLSGILLLLASNLSGMEPVFGLGLVTAAAATFVVRGIRRRYADSLLTALRSGLAEQVLEGEPGLPPGLERPDVRGALLSALDDPDPGLRRLAVMLLGRASMLTAEERERLDAVLDDPSPFVRAAAVVTLAQEAPDEPADAHASETLDALLSSDDPDASVAGLTAAERVPGRVSGDAIGRHLGAANGNVRAAAIRAACAHADAPDLVPTPLLLGALDDDALSVRNAAAWALGHRPDTANELLATLQTGSALAQDAALTAISPHARDVHEGLLSWAHEQIDRAAALHRTHSTVVAVQTAVPDRDFLATVIEQRAIRAEDRAIAALVALGAPAAGGLMRRSLRSRDQDARAQAIEALDSLGDRGLGRALTACLEAVDDPAAGDPRTVLDQLAQDDDAWISLLGRRVRGTMTKQTEEDVATTDGTGDQLDTMLLLRRVPLFARLEPEDLQRLAMVAQERSYADGAPLMREGELGDELVVLVEGVVRVVHSTAGGEERFIRRYEAGEHIGELAVLRERPRVATVIAEGDVRGLVIGGEGLRAILRERPEAAMAMLTTLAERLSTQ
jgi:HEAT repeat protein